jgi:hypothetical protein
MTGRTDAVAPTRELAGAHHVPISATRVAGVTDTALRLSSRVKHPTADGRSSG